ncbi:phosphoinositide 5-phosphatase [Theileria orientalis]|uniref:Phosphoinositide 5-phosphatase n=1 Tax=Theileria orientalis TaxID=68886 RepID=A0A976MBJ4_THEOR|nr:phosphoinositide 5-phosphatase [Theileria orientalis]
MVKVYILKIFASWYSIGLSHIFYSQNNESYTDGSETKSLLGNHVDYKRNAVTRLWINRSTGKITESNMPMTEEEPFFVIYVDAILGIVQIMNTSHLVVVTESDEVADLELGNLSFNGKNKGKIMTIKEVKFFPIDNSSDTLSKFKNKDPQNLFNPSILSNNTNSNNNTNGSETSSNEDGLDNLYYILIMISKILSSGHYYSYDTDLTNTMQSLYLNGHIPPKKTVNNRRDNLINEEFLIMNEKLYNVAIQDFNWCFMISKKLPNRWKTVVIQGYVGYVNEKVNGETVETLIIGRRSIKRSGTRFVSRGLDLDGNVGNFVGSEVRLRIDSGSWYSHTQARGSVPVFWSQSGTGKKIEFNDKLDNLTPFIKHIEILKEYYKPCTQMLFVSLLDVKNNENESILNDTFDNVVKGYNMVLDKNPQEPKITFVNYNYNSNAKWNTHEIVIQFVLDELLDHFNNIGFFDEEKHLNWLKNTSMTHKEDSNGSKGQSIRGLQKGILRTNCLDCLDRSNIFQWIASWVTVHMILNSRSKDNSIKIKNRLAHMLFGSNGTEDNFFTTFRNVWCDHGDYISIHQTGAPCTLSKRVKQPETSFNSLWYYGKVMAKRHYHSRFKDFKRQEALDILSQYCTSDIPSQVYQKDTESEIETKNQRHPFEIPERMETYHKPSKLIDIKTEHSTKRTGTDPSEPLPVNVIYLDITRNQSTIGYDVVYLGTKVIFKARQQFLFGVIKKGKRTIWIPNHGDYPDTVLIKPGLDGKPVVRVYFPKQVKNQKYIYQSLSQIEVEDSMQSIHKGESVDHETVFKPGLFEQLEHKGFEIPEPLKPKTVSVDIKQIFSNEGVEYKYNPSNQSYTFTAKQGFLIDKVTKSDMVLWDFLDHSYGYAVRVFVGNNEYGERVFRVYFPGAVPIHTDTSPKPQPQIVFNEPEVPKDPESVSESDELEIMPINVDIKQKLSDNFVRYEYNSNLDTHTFSSIYPCLINKVTRGNEVLWNCKDYGNEYGSQVLIFKQKNGKRMLRVYYGNQIPKPQNYVHNWDPGQLQEEITEFEEVYPDNRPYTPKIVIEDSRG